jgi:hypothetical protein
MQVPADHTGTAGATDALGLGFNPETPMRLVIAAAAACSLFASMAVAQDQPAHDGPANPAVKSMHENNSAAPVAGANSFTMAQAKAAIQAKGYTHVSKLTKDKDGVWRGTATKDGKSGPVSVDYQGNVN